MFSSSSSVFMTHVLMHIQEQEMEIEAQEVG
jgi:hypothetical protein